MGELWMDDPAYWQNRADETREAAASTSDQEMKAILEEIAKGYERIAEHVRNQ
jgi:hypothetical protein